MIPQETISARHGMKWQDLRQRRLPRRLLSSGNSPLRQKSVLPKMNRAVKLFGGHSKSGQKYRSHQPLVPLWLVPCPRVEPDTVRQVEQLCFLTKRILIDFFARSVVSRVSQAI